MNDAIISLKPRYADLVLSGKKSVELRNRIVRLHPGTKIWIYATQPKGCVVAFAVVKSVVHDEPALIWRRFERDICIEKTHFDSYTEDRERVSAVMLTAVRKLPEPPTLDRIRKLVGVFHPPQFYARLASESGLLGVLSKLAGNRAGGSPWTQATGAERERAARKCASAREPRQAPRLLRATAATARRATPLATGG